MSIERLRFDDWLYLLRNDIDWLSRDRLYWRSLFQRCVREVLPETYLCDAWSGGIFVRKVRITTSAGRLLARRRRTMRDKMGFRP